MPDGQRQNASAEEVGYIAALIDGLVRARVNWFDDKGRSRLLQLGDALIVAPYNAQVSDLSNRIPNARVGTVDKFQGQQAPVVIYSLTTSTPEDAPRGMEFLYSLNRLNVATSRAQAVVIVVGSPRLLEPECRSPRQMQLANALCWYVEMAQLVGMASYTRSAVFRNFPSKMLLTPRELGLQSVSSRSKAIDPGAIQR
jgi:hypothetical protein